MDASNEGNEQIPPLLDALLSVSNELIDTEVKRLKFLCQEHVHAPELQTVEEGYQLFEILQKRLIITETNHSFLMKLLGSIQREDLKRKFQQKMQTACRSPGLGSQPSLSQASNVHPQTDLRPPGDFPPISLSQAAVTHSAPTGLFADISKPVKDRFTDTNDSTPKKTSECDQSLHMANTLPKSATNKLPDQSQHLSKTLPRSRNEGPVSSTDGGPDEMKAVYNVDGTPRTTDSNGRSSLHNSQTFPRLDKRRVLEDPASSIDESPEMKAVYNVDGTPRITTSDNQSPHTSKTLPRSRSASEKPAFSRKSFPLTEGKGDVDDTPGTTPRNGQSLYASKTFPRSFKTNVSNGPASSINSSLESKAACTPRTTTRDAQSLNASQTVPRSATSSRPCGSASSSDGIPKMKVVCMPSTTASNGQSLHTSKTLPRSRSASEGQASSTDRRSKMKAVCDVYGTLRTTTSAGQSLHTSKTSPSSLTVMEGPPSTVEPSSATEAMCDVDDTPGATARNDQSVYASETFPRSFKTSVSTGPASSFNNSLESEAACTPRTPSSDVQSSYASQTVPRSATRSRSCGSASSSDGRPEMKAVCTPSTTASNAGSLHTSKTVPRSRSASEGQASSTDRCSKMKAVSDVYGTLRTNTRAGRLLHTSKTPPSSLTVMEKPPSTIENSVTGAMCDVDDTPGTTPRNGQSRYASETVPRSVNRSVSNGPASSSNSFCGNEAACISRTSTSDVQSSYTSQTVPRLAIRSRSCGSVSSNLAGMPMFRPKVSESSGGNDDVESLLDRLSLQDSTLSRSESSSHDLPKDVETDSPSVPQKQTSSPNNGHDRDAASLLAINPETDSPTSSHQLRDDRHRHVVSSPRQGQGSVPQEEMEVMRTAGKETEQGQVVDSHGETKVLCKKCSAYICRASELKQKGDNGHLTCISPDFATRVEETELANPQCSENIETIGIICCRTEGCDQLFGIKVRFLNLDPPFGYALNVEKFKTQKDGVTRCPRDWNQVLLDTST